MEHDATIDVDSLTFTYSGAMFPSLTEVSLYIDAGEFVLLAGPSGSGKSTLVKSFNGLVPHFHGGRFRGRVISCGIDVLSSSTSERATHVGFVFQDPENQLISTEVERELAFGMENLNLKRDIIMRRIEESLDAVGILHLRNREIDTLSGGEKQRVAIASVLALHPDVLILDEPTSELDPQGAEDVLNVIERLNDELGLTIILIEQRLDRVAHMVDRVVLMKSGKIVADGTPKKVLGSAMPSMIGIERPPITELSRRVEERIAQQKGGITVGEDGVPLTVKEGRKALRALFKQASNIQWSPPKPPNYGSVVVEMDNVWFARKKDVLKGISLELRKGEMVALLGRNSSGKTTLLKHLIGLNLPYKGSVKVFGMDTKEVSVATLAKKVGFVFQNPNDHLAAETVFEELASPLHNMGFKDVEERVEKTMDIFELTSYRDTYPRDLSGGERQRVAIASVMVFEPEILVLDEPTRGLDWSFKNKLLNILDEYRKKGKTVIYSTHDVETAARGCDRVIIMSEGKIVVDDERHVALSHALLFSPQINRLTQAFRHYGVPSTLLTVDEAIEVMYGSNH